MRHLQRFFSHWQNWISLLVILTFVGIAIAAPSIAPLKPDDPNPFIRVGRATQGEPEPPGEKAVLGMLPFGIDVFTPLVWGSRDALLFGLIVTLSTAFFGVFYGATSGFVGNRLGNFMLRIADSFLAFPPIAGLVFLQQLFATTVTAMGGMYFSNQWLGQVIDIQGPMTAIQFLIEHINPLMLSLIVFSWMPYARLVHSIVLTLKQTEFVQAARALGGSPFWIIRRHILRNSTGPAIVLAARDVGGVVLLQATLTFVRIGGDSVWGAMLSQGRDWVIGPGGSLFRYWWVFLPPTLAVMFFGIAWNLLGDGLNDALEPTSQGGFERRPFWRRKQKQDEPRPVAEERLPVAAARPPLPDSPSAKGPGLPPEPVQEASGTNRTEPILVSARENLSRGELSRALHAYSHLIQRGKLIDEILPDLARLVKSHPRNPQVWQTLGDALSRAGRTEHASQSYEQARKLKM